MPLADGFMPVNAAAERLDGIVYMNRVQSSKTDDAVEFRHRLPVGRFRADVISGGERMARVEADAEPLRLRDVLKNSGNLLELPAEIRSLPGGRFHKNFRLIAGCLAMNRVERFRDAPQARLFARTDVRSGMHYQRGNAQLLAAFDFDAHGAAGFFQ